MNEIENIKAFFTENRRKVMRVKAIEELSGVPKNTLLNLLTIDRAIPQRHIENLINVLKLFGYRPLDAESK
ncbi:hypothetical protein [Spirosoma litoris]